MRTEEEKIELILTWADDNPNFDTAFVESLKESFEKWGRLSEKQIWALDHIIEEWGIDE